MTAAADLRQLGVLAAMVRDAKLEAVRRAALARGATLARLADLESAPADATLHPVAAARAMVAYQVWADARRRELTAVLARQSVALAEAEAEARIAFGRTEVLDRLATRLPARK